MQLFGRTSLGWIKIIVFFHVFYFCLACFFLIQMFIFLRTIDVTFPKYTMYNGLIGGNPGIAFRPREDDFYLSSVIHFEHDYEDTWEKYKYNLQEYLFPYFALDEERKSYDSRVHQCDYDSSRFSISLNDPICSQNLESLLHGNCNEENDFGYSSGKPCILVKLNKIIGWYPEPLDSEDIEQRSWVPDVIRDAMRNNRMEDRDHRNDRVWIECHGKHTADKENLGPVNYYPEMGMPTAWFPYLNQANYLSPLMFLELANPKRGVLISVECTAWARNIYQDRERQKGVGYFQIMID